MRADLVHAGGCTRLCVGRWLWPSIFSVVLQPSLEVLYPSLHRLVSVLHSFENPTWRPLDGIVFNLEHPKPLEVRQVCWQPIDLVLGEREDLRDVYQDKCMISSAFCVSVVVERLNLPVDS